MKSFFCFCIVAVLCGVCGCQSHVIDSRSYIIDSNPQGLRVSVDNVELGFTPCKYVASDDSFYINVEPPSRQQLKKYEEKKQKIVSIWRNGPQSKFISYNARSGTIFFQFINSEYDIPKTEEDRKWVLQEIENDAENLERKQKSN